MNIIFSTENFLLQMNLMRDSHPKIIDEGGPHHNFWGITWDSKGAMYTTRTTDENTHFIEIRDKRKPSEVVGRINCPRFSFIHQILYVDVLNTLFVANTEKAEVLAFKQGSLVDIINFGEFSIPGKSHTNSLFFRKGFLYVGNHNRGKSSVIKYNVLTKEIEKVYYVGENMHDIWFENGEVTVCSSKNAEIVKYHAGCEVPLLRSNGFLRGVARTEHHLFLGETTFVPTHENPLPSHVKDPIDFAKITVWSTFGHELTKVFCVDLKEFGAKQVFSVRLLTEPDYAHKDYI